MQPIWNARINPAALLALIALTAFAMFGTRIAGSSGHQTGAAVPPTEATPVNQATADDVVFSLISWSNEEAGLLTIQIQLQNEGDLPVGIDAALVSLEVMDSTGASIQRNLLDSDPALPCSIAPGDSLAIAFSFDIDESDTPVAITIGITETNRTGAKVIFPLAPGAGASAIGGSGVSGGDAIGASSSGAQAALPPASPEASPQAGGCQS